jgi:hypothetical protein
MEDLKIVARVTRGMAESMAVQLGHLPADKLDWKPNPASKSALEVTAEVIGVMRMMLPVFSGGDPKFEQFAPIGSLEEAQRLLAETSEAYAAGLEAAGPELERPLETPMGTMWANYAIAFGMVDLIHHHGQITYLQSLLGDAENHMIPGAIERWWGPPARS